MNLSFWIAVLGTLHLSLGFGYPKEKLFCYLDSESFSREGLSKFSISDLEVAIPYCSHLIYGYWGIVGASYEISMIKAVKDTGTETYLSEIFALKQKFPHLKILLSVGGDRDIDSQFPNKYIQLLEGPKSNQIKIVQSASSLIKKHGFDGLDLAYQFPRNRPIPVMGWFASSWRRIVNFFSSETPVDPKAYEHKQQFTDLVGYFNDSLRKEGLMFGVTVLPNVNSTWYFDIPRLNNLVDYVNLAAFDFVTPFRNPKEADYTAPFYKTEEVTRPPYYNGEFQTEYWYTNNMTKVKIILGTPTYGNAWKMTEDSGFDGKPIVKNTDGPAPGGPQTKKPGILSYPEICLMLSNQTNQSPLIHTDDRLTFYGTYAFQPVRGSVKDGIWISYQDTRTVVSKAIHAFHFAGVSVFDLSYDDFRGSCTGKKFPLLRAINKKLLRYKSFVDSEYHFDEEEYL